jgi:DNA-binding winged helix-turn-helix (wHTH) protein/tetratricopeptide (TPR) repeat protein
LSLSYRTGDYIIHPKQHLIETDGQQIKVRSKVFSLMMLLLEHPDEILSKEYLLETIWDDVQVDQQVLFQSMREIRLLFKQHQVIKTHPRKGYSWIAELEAITETNNQKNEKLKPSNNGSKPMWVKSVTYLLVLTFGTILALWLNDNRKQTLFKGSVIVLPVKTSITDGDHNWLYLGAMDQIISQLTANKNVAVMHTDYVLEIMQRAELPRNYTSEQVARIFEVSGGKLVVESEFSGSVQDYRLAYKFYFGDHIKRGVIFNNTTAGALIELAEKITFYTGQSLKKLNQDANTEFKNELLARAIDLSNENNTLGASRLLASLVELEPSNLVASRLLSQAYIQQQNLDLAEQTIIQALQNAGNKTSAEIARLYFNLANIYGLRGNFELAETTLKQVEQLAKKNNDWLYRAYSAQQLALINQKFNRYDSAQNLLEKALGYHQIIQCPVGQSLTWLQMSDLSAVQGKNIKAELYLTQAEQLINQRQLFDLKAEAESKRNKTL